MTIQPVLALRRRIQAANQIHQCRLARTRGAHDRDIFVVLDAQVDPTQCVHFLVTHLIRLPQVVCDDDFAIVWAICIDESGV